MAVIKIPDNATNGDVIKAIFPETKDLTGRFGVYLESEWWSAPYKENKDGSN